MKYKWLVIIAGLLVGLVMPRLYLLGVSIVVLAGYRGCKGKQWPGYQLFLAYLFGGLATGAIVKFILYYGMTNQVVPLIVAPCVTWLFAKGLFFIF